MNFIKNNKVFLFLFLSFSIIIAGLSYRLIGGEQIRFNEQEVNNNQNTNNSINYFNGSFSEHRLGIEFSWNAQAASGNAVDKYEILQNEKVLKSGKNAASSILTLNEYDFNTGNNKFDLRVIFSDGEELTKSVYVYIDEVYNFNVSQKIDGNKLIYTLSYYYDERRPVTPPQMLIVSAEQNFEVKYVSTKEVSKSNHYILTNAIYELSYYGIEAGKYSVDIRWEFPNYHLYFNSNSIINVEG